MKLQILNKFNKNRLQQKVRFVPGPSISQINTFLNLGMHQARVETGNPGFGRSLVRSFPG